MITKIANDGTLAFDFIGQLLPYQQTGVEFMLRIDQEYGTVFNFDDMGMGKTVQTLAYMCRSGQYPTLILTAGGLLVEQWKQHVDQFTNITYVCYPSTGALKPVNPIAWNEYDVIVTTYTAAQRRPKMVSFCHFCFSQQERFLSRFVLLHQRFVLLQHQLVSLQQLLFISI